MSEAAVERLDAPGLSATLVAMCEGMTAHIDELTHADQAIGDGDHGLGVERGLKAAREAVESEAASADDVGAVLERFGTAMLTSMGGASGAVYGSLFRRGARGLKGLASFDAAALATFLEDGLAGVQERGGARVGDKTLVDPLAAAAATARERASDPWAWPWPPSPRPPRPVRRAPGTCSRRWVARAPSASAPSGTWTRARSRSHS